MPLPAATTSKAGGARPVDHFADQRRLIAIGERVDDARLRRAARKQRAGERIGLHVYHHDVLAVFAARERMAYAGGGAARRIDRDFDGVRPDHRERVVRDERGAGFARATASEAAAYCSAGQPTRCRLSLARCGARSQTATRCRPGVRRTCDRNIEPNFPAPISAMRNGVLSAARCKQQAVQIHGIAAYMEIIANLP